QEFLGKTRYIQYLPGLLLSTDTLASSFSTVLSNVTNKPIQDNYLNNGRLIRVNPPNLSMQEIFRIHLKMAYFDNWYKNYQMSRKQLDALQTIVDTCQQQGIDLKVFISPAHAIQWEAVHARELWTTFEDWKREVVKITPVWDFSGYNSITTEPLSDTMQNYLDSAHYFAEIGDLVLNRLYDYKVEDVPPDFGVLLTSTNVESHLAQICDQRETWATQNPEIVQLVQHWSREG
ncbi:MAG TPA: hypothetical protein V6D31_00355, partial [Candidatus Sericytochromatia bacterium]